MAGGIWSSQNKLRPGAYINFESTGTLQISVGERGIATMPLPLNWGGENSLIELTAEDLVTGKSLEKIGLLYTDEAALLVNLILQNCKTVKLFNTYVGGTKAAKTIGYTELYQLTSDTALVTGKTYYTRSGAGTAESPYVYTPVAEPDVASISTYYEKFTNEGITVTAKHPGTFGNKIAIVISDITNGYQVDTYANGYAVDTQRVASAGELVSNGFVDFTTTGNLVASSSTLLEGGTNGTIVIDYDTTYFRLLLSTIWNTMAIPSNEVAIQSAAINYIKDLRENEGKYVQVVVANNNSADYEGVINNINGVVLEDGTTINATDFVAWVAGATAGADIVDSLTGKVVANAVNIQNMLNNNEIVEALQNGKFVLSRNQNGEIKVEKDINSLHTFTPEKNYTFSKNRIIRELDEIGSGVKNIWEQTYLGKVSNNEDGRTLFKSSIINYLTQLRNDGAITDFDSETVTVEAGDDIDSVVASIAVKPVDSMELLYMTVNIA